MSYHLCLTFVPAKYWRERESRQNFSTSFEGSNGPFLLEEKRYLKMRPPFTTENLTNKYPNQSKLFQQLPQMVPFNFQKSYLFEKGTFWLGIKM